MDTEACWWLRRFTRKEPLPRASLEARAGGIRVKVKFVCLVWQFMRDVGGKVIFLVSVFLRFNAISSFLLCRLWYIFNGFRL